MTPFVTLRRGGIEWLTSASIGCGQGSSPTLAKSFTRSEARSSHTRPVTVERDRRPQISSCRGTSSKRRSPECLPKVQVHCRTYEDRATSGRSSWTTGSEGETGDGRNRRCVFAQHTLRL